ncbi:MAG TPA: glycosyltransferase family 39 protein [Thermoanaerobaculia bacterium]
MLRVFALIAALLVGALLGSIPLMDADEGRNGEVAREMAATNDYVMPRLDGLPYLDKPVLYFAAAAAAMEVLGPTELAARLPAYLFTLATAAVVAFFARRTKPGSEWVAAIVFLSIPLTIAFARTVIFDSALMFFATTALVALYFAVETRNKRWTLLAWASMGFAILTKGPVIFVLVLFVAIPYAIKRKAFGALWSIAGLVAFALIVAPWVYGVTQVVPEFLHYVLVTETASRMATDELQRTGPPWYFVPYLIGGALPWSIVLLFSWRAVKRREPETLFLLLWLVIPFLFFSISQSKRPQYIVPLMPPLALLVARIWDEARTRGAAITFAVMGAVLLAAPLFLHRVRMETQVAAVADESALLLGGVFVAAAVAALLVRRPELRLAALALPMLLLPLTATPLLRGITQRRSTHALVQQIRPHLTPSTQIVGVETFTGSLAFYLQRPIVVATKDASEMTSNYLLRRYEKYTTDPSSPLKPMPWLEANLRECCRPRIYLVRKKDPEHVARFDAMRVPRIGEGTHHIAYGPYVGGRAQGTGHRAQGADPRVPPE